MALSNIFIAHFFACKYKTHLFSTAVINVVFIRIYLSLYKFILRSKMVVEDKIQAQDEMGDSKLQETVKMDLQFHFLLNLHCLGG